MAGIAAKLECNLFSWQSPLSLFSLSLLAKFSFHKCPKIWEAECTHCGHPWFGPRANMFRKPQFVPATVSPKGNTVSLKGNTVSLKGNTVSPKGNTVFAKGNTVRRPKNMEKLHSPSI